MSDSRMTAFTGLLLKSISTQPSGGITFNFVHPDDDTIRFGLTIQGAFDALVLQRLRLHRQYIISLREMPLEGD